MKLVGFRDIVLTGQRHRGVQIYFGSVRGSETSYKVIFPA